MKKPILTTIIAVSVLSISSLSFAASYGKTMGASHMVVDGTIVSIDKAKNIFAIQDKEDGKIHGLSALDLSSLNKGDNVRVTVPLPGSVASKIVK